MKMTKEEYGKYVGDKAPKSRVWRNTALAWLIGGLICAGGQGLIRLYEYWGLSAKMASSSASMTLVFIAALLTALHLYDNLAKWGGGGTLVPITGFSNAIVAPAMEFKSEGLVAGLAAKMFTVAGPVLVFGIIASMLYGLGLLIFIR